MQDQSVMRSLVELPGWFQAAGWGFLSASGLLIGAVGGYYTWLQHTSIARVMTFAAGVLLAVVAVDLVIEARGAASLRWTVSGLLCGAAVFSSINWLLSCRGAQHRKRCGECVEQPKEEEQPGSGLAIAAGTFLDGVPEGMVLGLSVLHQGASGLGTVTAFFLSNIPEALSSSAGMRRAGRSARYCVTKWSKLDTVWTGVSVDTLLESVNLEAQPSIGYLIAFCDGGYTTNLPLPDVRGGKAWVVDEYDGRPLAPRIFIKRAGG